MLNEQELFWKGQFGEEYVDRVNGPDRVAAKISKFNKALNAAGKISSAIELGANIGLNADALKAIFPELEYTGVEIGDKAFKILKSNPSVDKCIHQSIHEFESREKYDLAMICGVMIHLNPETLKSVYKLLANLSKKYVLISEYYNPDPVEVIYRGHKGKLFKRDFAKEFMDETGFKLVDYGFMYRHDPKFRHADMTWFLLEK